MTEIEPFAGEASLDRLTAALRGGKTDRVPHFEILIEDQHVERLLGRKAGNTLGVGGDPAKGAAVGEGARPMYPQDYIELCQMIGQDAIALEALWTPLKRVRPDGTVGLITESTPFTNVVSTDQGARTRAAAVRARSMAAPNAPEVQTPLSATQVRSEKGVVVPAG
jgi:hypothetical protein